RIGEETGGVRPSGGTGSGRTYCVLARLHRFLGSDSQREPTGVGGAWRPTKQNHGGGGAGLGGGAEARSAWEKGRHRAEESPDHRAAEAGCEPTRQSQDRRTAGDRTNRKPGRCEDLSSRGAIAWRPGRRGATARVASLLETGDQGLLQFQTIATA